MKSFASFATCILALTISIAQAQTPQKSKPRRLTVSGGVLQGNAIKKVSPPYPPIARAARAAGKVEVQVTISEQGEVIEAVVVSGHPLLRDAAVNAAKQWVFKPTELDDTPVKVQGILTFNFTLLEDDSKEPEIVPRGAEEYVARGHARLAQGDYQGAIADFTKAIELDSKSALFHQAASCCASARSHARPPSYAPTQGDPRSRRTARRRPQKSRAQLSAIG
jgi:TonB family protein